MTPECSITVRNPAELITVTPYVIGFHPTDSVVVIGVLDGVVAFAARRDLPSPGDDVDAVPLAVVASAQPARYFAIIGYGPASRVTRAVTRIAAELERAGLFVFDALRVTEGRWWSYLCTPWCGCPPEGHPCLPPHHPLAATAVFHGMVALPNRKALVASVAPVEGAARAAMVVATARARVREAELRAAEERSVPRAGHSVPRAGRPMRRAGRPMRRAGRPMRRAGRPMRRAGREAVRAAEARYRAGGELTDDEAAWLGVLLADAGVFGYALDRFGPELWRLDLWNGLVRRVEPAFVAGPAALLAYVAWRAGNGPLARVALDRGLREDPGHRLLGVLDGLLAAGIGPHSVEDLMPPSLPVAGTRPADPRARLAAQARPRGDADGRRTNEGGSRNRREVDGGRKKGGGSRGWSEVGGRRKEDGRGRGWSELDGLPKENGGGRGWSEADGWRKRDGGGRKRVEVDGRKRQAAPGWRRSEAEGGKRQRAGGWPGAGERRRR
ncbi:DUF4192 family protein [Actinoplanes sp. CA-054009]